MAKIVLAPDSFKLTLSSSHACQIMKDVLNEALPDVDVISLPMADGGEGSLDTFLANLGGRMIHCDVAGPWGRLVEAGWAMLDDGTAIIECAQAIGLHLLAGKADPSLTSSYGVGNLVMEALSNGAGRIIITLGGSSTNDAGAGAAAACGVRFLDKERQAFIPTGATLRSVAHIDRSGVPPQLGTVPIILMCDVDCRFHGPEGAARLFSRQKGASDAMVEELDSSMEIFAHTLENETGTNPQDLPFSGAAGGLGGGLQVLLGAKARSGIETMLSLTHFDEVIKDASIVITGEGRIDGTSAYGKVVSGTARHAKALGVPVIAVCGDQDEAATGLVGSLLDALFITNKDHLPFEEVRGRAEEDLSSTMYDVVQFLKAKGIG